MQQGSSAAVQQCSRAAVQQGSRTAGQQDSRAAGRRTDSCGRDRDRATYMKNKWNARSSESGPK